MLFWQICLSVKQTQSSPFSSVLASTSAKCMFTNFIAKQQLPAAPAVEKARLMENQNIKLKEDKKDESS